jgi:hypothetical protein
LNDILSVFARSYAVSQQLLKSAPKPAEHQTGGHEAIIRPRYRDTKEYIFASGEGVFVMTGVFVQRIRTEAHVGPRSTAKAPIELH